jgi:hypothetical protein
VEGIPDDEVNAMLYGNACDLYRHELPEEYRPASSK